MEKDIDTPNVVAHNTAGTTFSVERFRDVRREAEPLTLNHFEEVGTFRGLEIDPDHERFLLLENTGHLRLFTMRVDKTLVGYGLFIVDTHLHHKKLWFAYCNLLYVEPKFRDLRAVRFLVWMDEQLRAEGVDLVHHAVTPFRDYSRTLERIGYTKSETGFIRRF